MACKSRALTANRWCVKITLNSVNTQTLQRTEARISKVVFEASSPAQEIVETTIRNQKKGNVPIIPEKRDTCYKANNMARNLLLYFFQLISIPSVQNELTLLQKVLTQSTPIECKGFPVPQLTTPSSNSLISPVPMPHIPSFQVRGRATVHGTTPALNLIKGHSKGCPRKPDSSSWRGYLLINIQGRVREAPHLSFSKCLS